MSNFAPRRTNYDTGDRRWLREPLKATTHGVTVTTASFAAGDIAADGTVKSGTPHATPSQGLLLDDLVIKAGETHLVSFVIGSTPVDRRFLPRAFTKAQEAALPAISFINGTAPAA